MQGYTFEPINDECSLGAYQLTGEGQFWMGFLLDSAFAIVAKWKVYTVSHRRHSIER